MSAVSDPKANLPIRWIDPDFAAQALRVADPLWSLPGLTDKQRAFLCIASDIACGWLGLPFVMHVNIAFKSGADKREVKEVILHAAPYAGFTKALSAMIRFKLMTFWRRSAPPDLSGGTGVEDGAAAFDPATLLPPEMDDTLAAHFRKTILPVWKRPGLGMGERALITLACDVIRQSLGPGFHFHLRVAKASGLSDEQCRETILFVSEYAFGSAWRALDALAKTSAAEESPDR